MTVAEKQKKDSNRNSYIRGTIIIGMMGEYQKWQKYLNLWNWCWYHLIGCLYLADVKLKIVPFLFSILYGLETHKGQGKKLPKKTRLWFWFNSAEERGGGLWKQAYRLLDIKASKICMEKQLNILCLIRNRKGFQRGEMCNWIGGWWLFYIGIII